MLSLYITIWHPAIWHPDVRLRLYIVSGICALFINKCMPTLYITIWRPTVWHPGVRLLLYIVSGISAEYIYELMLSLYITIWHPAIWHPDVRTCILPLGVWNPGSISRSGYIQDIYRVPDSGCTTGNLTSGVQVF